MLAIRTRVPEHFATRHALVRTFAGVDALMRFQSRALVETLPTEATSIRPLSGVNQDVPLQLGCAGEAGIADVAQEATVALMTRLMLQQRPSARKDAETDFTGPTHLTGRPLRSNGSAARRIAKCGAIDGGHQEAWIEEGGGWELKSRDLSRKTIIGLPPKGKDHKQRVQKRRH